MSEDIPKTMRVVGYDKSEDVKLESITLCCAVIEERFSEYYVNTDKKKFEKTINDGMNESRDIKIKMFKALHDNLTKYTDEELDRNFNEKNKVWDEWCKNVALFYAYRHILFPNKPIPIAHPSLKKT